MSSSHSERRSLGGRTEKFRSSGSGEGWDVIERGAIVPLHIILGVDAAGGMGGQFAKCHIPAVLSHGPLADLLGQLIIGAGLGGAKCETYCPIDNVHTTTCAGLPRGAIIIVIYHCESVGGMGWVFATYLPDSTFSIV